jgi:hypothetical protein
VQPGWDWVPARWVRRPDGWEFRAGYWAADSATVGIPTRIGRRITARPVPSELPPADVESAPGLAGTDADAGIDRLPLPPGSAAGRDVIAGEEADLGDMRPLTPGEFPAVIVGPVTGLPYYVIRPRGMYPYGPNGVIVPGAVPPFVRRILDRVLP